MKLNCKMVRCNLSNLSQLEHDLTPRIYRKEVDFEGGKVLVSRLGDKIHATSAFCTHYGAPLAKGVLTSDGRVIWYVIHSLLSLDVDFYCSPWHGGEDLDQRHLNQNTNNFDYSTLTIQRALTSVPEI
jgi:hypothetical protein